MPRTKPVEFDGKSKSVMEWAKELHISPATLYWRLRTLPLQEAMVCKKTNGSFGKKPTLITFQGRTQTRSKWCNELGIGISTLGHLLEKHSEEKAMIAGFLIGLGKKKITFNGQTLSVSEWGKKLGMSKMTIYRRLKKMPLEKALGTC